MKEEERRYEEAARVLPGRLREQALAQPPEVRQMAEEFRLRAGQPLAVLLPDRAYSWLMRYERFGMLLLLAVISVGIGSNALDSAIRWTFTLLCRLVGFEV